MPEAGLKMHQDREEKQRGGVIMGLKEIESSWIVERRKLYRYSVPSSLKEQYTVTIDIPHRPPMKRAVNNLNIEGVNINLDEKDLEYLSGHKEFVITLSMGDDVLSSLHTFMIRSTPGLLVLSFVKLTKSQQDTIQKHFPILLGRALEPMKAKQGTMDLPVVWYHGDTNADLFLMESGNGEKGFCKVEFTFEDSIIQWEAGDAVKTGKIARDIYVRTAMFRKYAILPITYDAKPNPSILKYALIIIDSSLIKEEHKKFLKGIFQLPK